MCAIGHGGGGGGGQSLLAPKKNTNGVTASLRYDPAFCDEVVAAAEQERKDKLVFVIAPGFGVRKTPEYLECLQEAYGEVRWAAFSTQLLLLVKSYETQSANRAGLQLLGGLA